MSNQKITTRKDDYSQWYLDVIDAADLADNSPVRGCMVIKPYGFSLWDNIKNVLDNKIKATGVENAYFPLFIPKSFFEKEAEHVQGFAKECAVVTHHRLELDKKTGKLIPAGPLDEPLIVRPTSETIIYDMYSKWIQSYRDLPILINQWANVVRWEMRTRSFLRTMEFLWQEGHTAHATKIEAENRAQEMLQIYIDFVQDYLAIPVLSGKKSESEKFAGADTTYCIEALMQDGKALQAGTSHMLGQNFSKAFNISFLDDQGESQFAWQTSWGVSTRIIGALIMVHSDDQGLVLPPKIAPIQVVIIPIFKDEKEKQSVLKVAQTLAENLKKKNNLAVKIDERDLRPGVKFFEWEKRGVPIRIEIGPKDVMSKSVVVARRDTGEKIIIKTSAVVKTVNELLEKIQSHLFDKAKKFMADNSHQVDTWEEFEKIMSNRGGFVYAPWCGRAACEEEIKEKTKATIRVIPGDQPKEKGRCVHCSQPSENRVVFAKAY